MSSNNQHREFIKLRPACLMAFIALVGFAMAVAVFLAFFISKDSWSFRLPACPGPRATPSFLQIQVLGHGEHSARDVAVDPEKNPWASEVISAIQQIQAKDNGDSSVGSVVLDPEQNKWIDKPINALRDAGKRQSGVPVVGANPTSNVEIDREKNLWVGELITALQQIQAKVNEDVSVSGVIVDPNENPWIDEMLAVLRNAVETQVTDTTVREYIEQQMPCTGDANSSTACPAPEVGTPDAVAPGLRGYIQKQMNCADKEHLKMSGFIRFSNNNAEINDAAEKMKINEFVARTDKRGTKWGVFGFASEAGEKDSNRKLSWQRACGVTKYICNEYNCQSSGLDCNTYPKDQGEKVEVKHTCAVSDGNPKSEFLIYPLGEDHFINGVADSRSVVIAACEAQE